MLWEEPPQRLWFQEKVIVVKTRLIYKFLMHHFLQTDIEITKEEDFARILQMEEEYIQHICEDIIRLKPDLVFTEKGISGI